MFQGNWIDLTILIFLFAYAKTRAGRGFLILFAEIITFTTSFIVSLRYYNLISSPLSTSFPLSHSLATVLGFMILAIVSQQLISRTFTQIYDHLPKIMFRSKWNFILGFIPALADGLIICVFAITALMVLPFNFSLKGDMATSLFGSKLFDLSNSAELFLNKVFGEAITDGLNFLTVKSGSSQNINLHFRTTNFFIDTSSENEMLTLVNNERIKNRLKPLILEANLRFLARKHSQDMLTKGYFSHISLEGKDPFDRMKKNKITYQVAGENIAFAPSAQVAHIGLMNSPEHRANILNPDFNRVGIGTLDSGTHGRMFTQVFTN